MLSKALAVRAVSERYIQGNCVIHRLLQASLDRMIRVFCLNDSDRHIPLIHEQIVGLLGLLSGMEPLANDDLAVGEVVFSKYLPVGIPFSFECRIDQLQAHI